MKNSLINGYLVAVMLSLSCLFIGAPFVVQEAQAETGNIAEVSPAATAEPVAVAASADTVSNEAATSDTLFDVLALLVGGEAAAKWFAILGLVAWVLTQLMAWLPTQWVAKCPSWLIKIIQLIAGNYRKSANGISNNPEQPSRIT